MKCHDVLITQTPPHQGLGLNLNDSHDWSVTKESFDVYLA